MPTADAWTGASLHHFIATRSSIRPARLTSASSRVKVRAASTSPRDQIAVAPADSGSPRNERTERAVRTRLLPRDLHHSASGGLAMNVSRSDERQRAAVISRRRLLQAGGIGALALGLPGTVAASVNGNRGLGRRCRGKVVHFLLALRRAQPSRHVGPEAGGARGNSRPLPADRHLGPRHADFRAASPAGRLDPPFQPDPVDDACRQHQQPFRRHAPLPERPGRLRPPTLRTSAPSWQRFDPTRAASRPTSG